MATCYTYSQNKAKKTSHPYIIFSAMYRILSFPKKTKRRVTDTAG